MNNLFSDVPADFPDEFFDTILDNDSVRIERIVSHGHASATDYWYDQDRHEWIVFTSSQSLPGTALVDFAQLGKEVDPEVFRG